MPVPPRLNSFFHFMRFGNAMLDKVASWRGELKFDRDVVFAPGASETLNVAAPQGLRAEARRAAIDLLMMNIRIASHKNVALQQNCGSVLALQAEKQKIAFPPGSAVTGGCNGQDSL